LSISGILPERAHSLGGFISYLRICLDVCVHTDGYARSVSPTERGILVATNESLALVFAHVWILCVVTLDASTLGSAELRIEPHFLCMLGMEMQIRQEFHALDVRRLVIKAVEVLMVAYEWPCKPGRQRPLEIESIRQVMDELI